MTGITSRLERDLIKIKESLLAQWQKLDAIRTFIQPFLTYIFCAYPVYQSTLKNYRKTLIATLRSICHLPKHATSSYFFASRQVGCLGLQDPFPERHIQTIVQTVKMLSLTARAHLNSALAAVSNKSQPVAKLITFFWFHSLCPTSELQ